MSNFLLFSTHAFKIRQRPIELEGKTIINVNVRGKRGNIIQVNGIKT